MEVKFTSDLGELDLSEIKISMQESNSKVSDQKFSKFMFPFEIMASQEFIKNYGDYVSYETTGLQNMISGFLSLEGKVHEAKLFIQDIQGLEITAQIDFGFEELPNFDKKLSELNLEEFEVPDIYTYAKQITEKKYPATNFNFPRIYTKKYPTTNEVWKNFDGYYNDLKPDGSEMRRNYVDEAGLIWNVNIIHPCPHVLYLLKAGFADAGLTLSGDILNDENLKDRWVFSGGEYFTTLQQRRFGFKFTSNDYTQLYLESGPDDYARYEKDITLEKPGQYKIAGVIEFFKAKKMWAQYRLSLNGQTIWSRYHGSDKQTIFDPMPINIDFNVMQENSELKLYIWTQFHDSWSHQMADLLVTSALLDDVVDEEGSSTGVVTNLNEVNLKKAVPEMTFGEYVNALTNWFNYDVEIRDKTVIMNKIQTDEIPEAKGFEFMEVPKPKRTLLNKKSFLLKFPEMDEGFKKDSMYYDYQGAVLNGTPKADTSIIEANGYAMELKLPKEFGYLTANVMKDSNSIVALVEYDGLNGGQNNAKYTPGCDHPQLFDSNWAKFLRIRINGQEYNWSKNCSISKISQYSVKDFIFCYNNIHIIKSMNKEKVSPNVYNIELVTETVV